MNVCLIMPNVFPVPATKGGATETLINNLLKENEKKAHIHFICISVFEPEAKKQSEEYKYTEFIYIEQKRDTTDLTFSEDDSNFYKYMDNILENIKDRDIDFFIIEGGDISGYEYLLKNLPKKKCLVHIHGDELGNNNINSEIYSKFLAISEYTRKLIKSDGIIQDDKIELLYNAINIDEFDKIISNEEKELLREKYDIQKDDTVIMFLGRTIPQKGVKELILAFKKLKNIERSKILIVGSSNYGEKVENEFEQELAQISEDVKDKIKFTGYIENTNLYKIQNIVDIAVVPSMWEELFGLVVVENMASGLPLVVTRSGGIPEIVNDDCAFIINKDENLIDNMAERLDYLIEHPELRKKMGEHGRQRAKLFGMEQYLENFYNIMKKMKE